MADNPSQSKEIRLGEASAYAIAVKHGYLGTEAQWVTELSNASTNAAAAAQNATAAADSASSASTSATAASNSATAAANSATSASSSATTAESAKTAALTAQGVAQTAQAAAEQVLSSIPQEYSELSSDVSNLKSHLTPVNLADGVTYTGYYYVDYRTGENTAGNSYKASSMIDISGCSKILYSRLYTANSTSYAGIAFYDENQAFINNSGIPSKFKQASGHFSLEVADVPTGAKYVRCSGFRTGDMSLLPIEVYDYAQYSAVLPIRIETLEEKMKYVEDASLYDTFCTLAMFEKIGIIGDSYAMGSLYIPNGASATYVGTYNNLSWGKNLERIFGNNVSFFAHGGLSTQTWLTSSHGISALETAAETSPCNLYWFGLGINDVGLYKADNSYLGDLTDISEHVAGSDWANTFYGNVGQIITRVLAASPSSKIVISSFVGYRPQAQIAEDIALNDALAEIAEYMSIPFIDLKNDKFYMSAFYSDNILGKHPIAMVYAGMAMANARLFGKAVIENQEYFKDYHMGTPNPDPEPDDPE